MLFTNWLIATIIQSYHVYKMEVDKERKKSGTLMLGLFDEFQIIKKKMIRSIKIYIWNVIKYIQELTQLRKLMALKKKDDEKSKEKEKSKKVVDLNNNKDEIEGFQREEEVSHNNNNHNDE